MTFYMGLLAVIAQPLVRLFKIVYTHVVYTYVPPVGEPTYTITTKVIKLLAGPECFPTILIEFCFIGVFVPVIIHVVHLFLEIFGPQLTYEKTYEALFNDNEDMIRRTIYIVWSLKTFLDGFLYW